LHIVVDQGHPSDAPTRASTHGPGRLTVFAFLWACQALVHQEFFPRWASEGDLWGWILTAFALATLVRPSAIWLFTGMLVSSVVYNTLEWPFVVNHILVESLINLTILGAIAGTLLSEGGSRIRVTGAARERIYFRMAPVVKAMLVLMYYFAFVAKLNRDFVNPDVSCVVAMYGDLLRRFPFLPPAQSVGEIVIAMTLVVEAAIPVLLTFRRTRYFGVLLGVGFHFMLGLIGHRTFSALAIALYGLFCMEELVVLVGAVRHRLTRWWSDEVRATIYYILSSASILGVALLIGAFLTGHFRSGIGPLAVYRVPWMIWILWFGALGVTFAACAWLHFRRGQPLSRTFATAAPAWLWLMVLPVALNGMSQYLGFKTETCFTMYSNLRTEGGVNNHFFMPALRLASYQDDLVRIVSTSIPELEPFTHRGEVLAAFEMRRVLGGVPGDFEILVERHGQLQEIFRRGDLSADSDLLRPPPVLLAKLLYFRPVSTAGHAPCQH